LPPTNKSTEEKTALSFLTSQSMHNTLGQLPRHDQDQVHKTQSSRRHHGWIMRVTYLAAGELELGAAKSLNAVGEVSLLAAHREQRLANVDAGDSAGGLAEGTTHTCASNNRYGLS
jgi:hypothetical protein